MTFSPDLYQKALHIAAKAHVGQKVPGSDLPYVVHVTTVASEILAVAALDQFDVDFAVACALLHDTIEDTGMQPLEIEQQMGAHVARGVQALSKDAKLPKSEQMGDSLDRIRREPREVWMVKLADRIANLAEPPQYWSREKRLAYREEARKILEALGGASVPLARRLEERIDAYLAYIDLPR